MKFRALFGNVECLWYGSFIHHLCNIENPVNSPRSLYGLSVLYIVEDAAQNLSNSTTYVADVILALLV